MGPRTSRDDGLSETNGDELNDERLLDLRRHYGQTVHPLTAGAEPRAVLTEPDGEHPPELAIRDSIPAAEIAGILDAIAELLRKHLDGGRVFEAPRLDRRAPDGPTQIPDGIGGAHLMPPSRRRSPWRACGIEVSANTHTYARAVVRPTPVRIDSDCFVHCGCSFDLSETGITTEDGVSAAIGVVFAACGREYGPSELRRGAKMSAPIVVQRGRCRSPPD